MRNALIFIFVILVGLIGSTIQAGELINYQGRLTDSFGNPVADTTYQLTFSLYDDSTDGFLQWSEVHPSVQTKDGLFCVILGSVDHNLDASIFEIEPLYLEIQVGVEVISPRTRLTSAPSAIRAKNMSGGDIETGPSLLVVKSATGDTGIIIGAATDKNSIMRVVLNNLEGDPIGPMVEMTSNPMASSGVLIHAAQPTFSGRIALTAHQSDSSEIVMYREGYVPHDEKRALGMRTSSNGTFLTMYNPDEEYLEQALVEMKSQSSGGSIEFFPAGDMPHDPAIRMGFDPTPFSPGRLEFFDPAGSMPHDPYVRMGLEPTPFAGGKLEFFDPGSGWPDNPMMVMGTDGSPFHEASFRMYNPSPVPPPKLVELTVNDSTGDWGSYFNMFAMEPPDKPIIQMTTGSSPTIGGSIKMFNPQPEPPARIMEMKVDETATPGEWESKIQWFLVHPPEYPTPKEILSIGSAPSTGASFKMFNPQPEPPARVMEMSVNESADEWGSYFNMYSIDPGDDEREIFQISNTASSGASVKMFNPQPEPPARVMEMSVNESMDEWGGYFDMYSMDPGDDGEKIFEIRNIASSGASVKMFNPQPGRAATTVLEMKYDSTNGGGTVVCHSDADGSTATLTGRDFTFSDGTSINVYINYAGGAYLKGSLGVGVFPPTNILHVQQSSATDPIADAWTTYSSRRWKDNIQPLQGVLDQVKKLRGVSFQWKADGKHDIGMIAEEVGEVVPEVVAYEENGVDARSIDYGRLTALLVEAVKEQQDQIKELNVQITDLQEALQKLQATNR